MITFIRHCSRNLKLKYKIFGAFLGLTVTLFLSIELIHKPFINPERATIHLIQTDLDVQVSSFFSLWTLIGVSIPLLFFSWLIIQLVMQPIKNMGREMNSVIAGNLDVSLKGHSRDEFGEMADIFNTMAKSLKNTQEELIRSNEDLEHFTGIVAHDLKEPLRKIMFYAMLLKDTPSDMSLAKNYATSILDVSNRMTLLLNDLLEFAKVNRAKLSVESLNTRAIINLVISDLHAQIQRTDADIQIDNHLPVIAADPLQIRIVFQNLISNALKFQKPGIPPSIHIVGKAHDDTHVEISIQDNGIGFDPSESTNLFMPFERLQNAQNIEGTGLGLFTVKRILDRHHGTMSVSSAPGKGSTFSLIFPTPPEVLPHDTLENMPPCS